MQIEVDKKLYWIDTKKFLTLYEWYLEQEDNLRKRIVKENQKLWNYYKQIENVKSNKTILIKTI